MHSKLETAITNLIHGILNYKSVTWDSKESGITQEQAEIVAAFLIEKFLFSPPNDYIQPGESIDGIEIKWAVKSALEYLQNSN